MHYSIQTNSFVLLLTTGAIQGGGDDGEGGGSDIGALLGNLGPLIGSLSGVSKFHEMISITLCMTETGHRRNTCI
jgi:hypothetical protein